MKNQAFVEHDFIDESLLDNISEEVLFQAMRTRFPSPIAMDAQLISKEDKISSIAEKFRDIMLILGLDLTDDSLKRTPDRVAKMYVEELFSGLDASTFPRMSFVKNQARESEHSNMVFVQASFTSFCEHHFVPMFGKAFVAYLPKDKLIGLSKIARIVRFFARRPQLQERLTAQIADSLSVLLDTDSVAVSLQAEHHCIKARGIENENGQTITNVLTGLFDSDQGRRREFFEAVNRK